MRGCFSGVVPSPARGPRELDVLVLRWSPPLALRRARRLKSCIGGDDRSLLSFRPGCFLAAKNEAEGCGSKGRGLGPPLLAAASLVLLHRLKIDDARIG